MRIISFSHDFIHHLDRIKRDRGPTIDQSAETNKNTNQNNNEKIAVSVLQVSSTLRYEEYTVLMCILFQFCCFQSNTDSHKSTDKNSPPKTFSPMDFLSYTFYFPFFFTGPIYTYDRFYKEV